MRAWLLTICVVVFLVGSVGVGTVMLNYGSWSAAAIAVVDATVGQPVSGESRPIRFVVHTGDSAAQVGSQLQAAGLVRSALGFRLAVRLSGLESHLEAGDYDLRPNMPLNQVVSVLAQGRMAGGMVTIPEGWRTLEIADALQRDRVTSQADFIQATAHPDFPLPSALQAIPNGRSLEGFLFPDSYRFGTGTSADRVAQIMVDDFAQHLSPDLTAGFQANGLTLYQAVTLASIVEREAVMPAERPTIASVYLNRWRRGMLLQADPTVQYALVPSDAMAEPSWGYWKSALTVADLTTISPYNTYVVKGLPPGPICNPGLASLEAVARPATTDFLYFVARPDRSHAFSQTLQEQEQNVARYRQ